MATYKLLIALGLATLIISCGNKKELENNYTIQTSAIKNAIVNGGDISFSLKAKKNYAIDSVVYSLENTRLGASSGTIDFKTTVNSKTLGYKTVKATIYTEGETASAQTQITLLNAKAPKIYGYEIVNRFPHQVDAYTQGLEFTGDDLYESNGQYGESNLRKLDYKTGEVQKEVVLDNAYFAEGLTLINGKIHQLTWREGVGFTYDIESLEKTGTFNYRNSREGWGLCNDGKTIYKSDGTTNIWLLDPNTMAEQSYIQPTDHKGVKKKFNELEFVNGKIYANTYQLPSIAIIEPSTGAIEGIIDLRSLPAEVQEGLDKDNEVLNGIAYKRNEDRLFVTGKHWNTLFEIKLVEK